VYSKLVVGRLALFVVAAAGCGFRTGAARVDGAVGSDVMIVPGCGSSWFDGRWTARDPLTIHHQMVAADQSDFPVLVDVTLAPIRADGADLRFTAADGRTQLDYELDTIDAATGHVLAWVRVPALSASNDTALFVYHGNAGAVTAEDPAQVWMAGYSAVWHLREDPSGTAPQMHDSTGHGLDGTSRGTMVAGDQMTGKIGGSLDFDGTDDGLDVPSNTLGTTFSYEIWIRKTSTSSWKAFFDNWPAYDRWFGTTDSQMSFWDGGANVVNSNITVGNWYYMVATYDGSNVRIYRNATQLTPMIGKSFAAVTSTMQIGYTNTSLPEFFPGQLDEARVSTVARSPEYIQTSYANQNMPGAFATAGTMESCP
jgi:biopolymer transport protein ExbB